MLESQSLAAKIENSGPGDAIASPSQRKPESEFASSALATGSSGIVDQALFNDLVAMVPLVQSLIDQKAKSSYTHHGLMVCTKTPSRESLSRKAMEVEGRVTRSMQAKKKREVAEKDHNEVSLSRSRNATSEKDMEELCRMRGLLEDLKKKLLEENELLEEETDSKAHIEVIHAKAGELKQHSMEKDCLIKSLKSQLSEAKMNLADRQAALEKIQWELKMSDDKAENLREELESLQTDISLILSFFKNLANKETITPAEDYDVKPFRLDMFTDIDFSEDLEMQKLEEARKAYADAVAEAEEKKDNESIEAAAMARLNLQSVLYGSQ